MIDKITLPEENYNVPDYDEKLANKTNEIVDEVNEHGNKITQLLAWMGLVKDYVIEYGSNINGSWEKWNSGKLVQKVNVTISVPFNVAELQGYRSEQIAINYPIIFLTEPKIYGLTCNALSYSSLQTIYNDRINVYFLAFRDTRTVTYVSFEAIGTWK